MAFFDSYKRGRGEYSISARFRNINILFFVLASIILTAVLLAILRNITKTVSEDYARLYATNTVGVLNTHLNGEIALMTKAAHSKEIADWFEDEGNPEKKAAALEEMQNIIEVLYSDNIYVGIQKTLNEFTVEEGYTVDDVRPFATLVADYYNDEWYFDCISSPHDYVFNVDIDKILKRKRVWLNYKVVRDGELLGVICSGLEFARVAEELFSKYDSERVRGIIIDRNGSIQMDSLFLGDDDFIYYEIDDGGEVQRSIYETLDAPALVDAIKVHLSEIDGYFDRMDEPALIMLTDKDYDYATIANIEGTDWSVVTLYNSSSLFSAAELLPLFIIIPALFVAYALFISAMCYRLIFSPFKQLTGSLTHVNDNNEGHIFGLDRRDEFGELANTIQDMNERIKAEKKVRNLAAIAAIADAGIVIKDKDDTVLEWNIGAENILGYKDDEIIGHTAKYYAPETEAAAIDEIENRLRTGEHIAHLDVVRKHKDGRLIDCSASYTPVFDRQGIYIGSVAVFHDISEKKQIELKLKDAVLAAEEASKAKSVFLANMSHEIRTPINGVVGFAELALGEDGISESLRDYLLKIKKSSDSLLKIINDILDVSKIEAGAVMLESVPFELGEIFRDCETISSLKAIEKGIALHFYAEPFVGRRLLGDPTKLRQVLLNLLSNAIKFTNYGMVKLTAVLAEDAGDMVQICFEVKDSGIGMTPEQMQNIFEPFVQADNSTTRKYGGTGLGLAISNSFVELMGGKLILESTFGLGSKFSFTLPFKTVRTSEKETRKEDRLPVLKKPVFSGVVLVCEDNAINQEVIEKHLLRVGLTSVTTDNGRQGIEAVRERMESGRPFDLILMDIHMPVMDGLEAMQRLLEMGSETPVIALTANAMITDKEKYLSYGMSDYLSKPFTAMELWVCLSRHLKPVDFITPAETAYFSGGLPYTGNERPNMLNDVLNEDAGLKNVMGDIKFYERLKRNFHKDNSDIIQRLNNALRENDIKAAHRMAHSLKGTARVLGAERLTTVAGNLENALSGGENNYVSEMLEVLEAALAEVLTAVKHDVNEERPGRTAEGLDIERAVVLIGRLMPMLRAGDPESVEYADEVRSVLASFSGTCEKLAEQMEDYDFDAAAETICIIKAGLNI